MRVLVWAVAGALALGTSAQAALVDYAELFGGVTIEPPLTWNSSQYDMDSGLNFGGALGWDVAPELSVEVEGMYTKSNYSCCARRLETMSVMVNGVWHFDVGSAWKPYIGAGIGGVQSTFDYVAGNESDFVFGYQGFAGMAIPLNSDLD